jgi:hypothetical protein
MVGDAGEMWRTGDFDKSALEKTWSELEKYRRTRRTACRRIEKKYQR